MFISDISELPLIMTRIITYSVSISSFYISALYAMTLMIWVYWRIWIFCTKVLTSIANESKSRVFVNKIDCQPGSCLWVDVPDRYVFVVLLSIILVINIHWSHEIFVKVLKGKAVNGAVSSHKNHKDEKESLL